MKSLTSEEEKALEEIITGKKKMVTATLEDILKDIEDNK